MVYGSNGVVGTHTRKNTSKPSIIVGRKGSFGKITWAEDGGFCIDTAYYVDRNHSKGDLRFSFYLLQHLRLDKQSKDSAVPGLDRSDALNRTINLFDFPNQRAIADFLDRETGHIDQLIEKKQRFVDLLEEKNSALIIAAVTGQIDVTGDRAVDGLDNRRDPQRGALKSTNLRWLAKNLDYLRIPLNATERAEQGGDVPYWGANGIVDYVNRSLIDEPVILVGEDGAPFFARGKDVAFCVDGNIWPNNHIHILSPHQYIIDNRYLCYFLNQVEYANYINGSTRAKLTQAQLGSIVIHYPYLETQKAIADFLDRETGRLDQLIKKIRYQIDLLREKRSALITAAVTGQIDVTSRRVHCDQVKTIDAPQRVVVRRRSPTSSFPFPHT